MPKSNCWELCNCGRGPAEDEAGICPAASDTSAHGLNGGTNGGRICWAVAGTFCGWKVQGTFAQREITCMSCKVFKRVRDEEGVADFLVMRPETKHSGHAWL